MESRKSRYKGRYVLFNWCSSAFNCPIGVEGSFDEHELEFEQTEANPLTSYHVNSAGIFDGGVSPVKLVYGKVLRLNHDLFIEDALVFKIYFLKK